MKSFAIILFVAAFVQGTTLQAIATNNGRQTRQISGFHGVSVSSGIDLFLSQKNTEEVVVEAESDDLNKIITEVEGGILKIYIREKSWFNMNWSKSNRKVYVSFKLLDKLDASAGSDVVSQGFFKLDNLDLDVSSGSNVKIELEANKISAESSSGSDLNIAGKVTYLQVNASSGSDINAADLQARKCIASVSSGSDIRINVTDELDASASSGGDISYSGNPKSKEINESSGGDVHSR